MVITGTADGPTPARACLWHVPRLAAILWAFTRATPWLPAVRSRREDIAAMIRATRRGWVRLARDRRGAAGFLVRDRVRIHALYVHPRAQRQGVGQALLEDAKSRSERLELWVLEANMPARGFYAAQGFAESRRGGGAGNDEKLPDILMVWHRRHGRDP